jgi:alpha-mannosidase
VRLDGRLLAGQPWLELVLSLDWRQRHELLRLEIPLARPALRWAADAPAGVLERPAEPRNPREAARWEVPALAWLASVEGGAAGGGLAVLLDGPQGVDATPERLGVSLLRGPTWPDPGADNGWQRQRLALMPCPEGWRPAGVPGQEEWLHLGLGFAVSGVTAYLVVRWLLGYVRTKTFSPFGWYRIALGLVWLVVK